MRKKLFIIIGVILFIGGTCNIGSANLITNGNFETGDLTGWNLLPLTQTDEVYVTDDPDILTNLYAHISDSDSNGIAGIYQTFYIPTEVNFVNITFDYYFAGYDNSNIYSDIFNSTFFFRVNNTNVPFLDWRYEVLRSASSEDTMETVVHYSVVADVSSLINSDPNALIEFGLIESSSSSNDLTDTWIGLDNVNVAPVPEPATILLFGTGLIGLAGAARKKIKKA